MIAVEEALALVLENSFPLKESEILPISQCINRNLAKAVKAPIDLPSFRLSSVDGYALCLHQSNTYSIVDEVKAGDSANPSLKIGECVRIFTGAVVPDNADAVIMQEKTIRNQDTVTIEAPVNKGQNIRLVGSQVKKETFHLKKDKSFKPQVWLF